MKMLYWANYISSSWNAWKKRMFFFYYRKYWISIDSQLINPEHFQFFVNLKRDWKPLINRKRFWYQIIFNCQGHRPWYIYTSRSSLFFPSLTFLFASSCLLFLYIAFWQGKVPRCHPGISIIIAWTHYI